MSLLCGNFESFILHLRPIASEKKRKVTDDLTDPKKIVSVGTRLEFNPKKYCCQFTGKDFFNIFIEAYKADEPFCIAKTNSVPFELYDGTAAVIQLNKNPHAFNKTGMIFFKYCPEITLKEEASKVAHFEIFYVIAPRKGV